MSLEVDARDTESVKDPHETTLCKTRREGEEEYQYCNKSSLHETAQQNTEPLQRQRTVVSVEQVERNEQEGTAECRSPQEAIAAAVFSGCLTREANEGLLEKEGAVGIADRSESRLEARWRTISFF
jgi:hypothetical protein